MIDRHGFASAWFGRRTRSLCKGGRRIGCIFVEAPFGGILLVYHNSIELQFFRNIELIEGALLQTVSFQPVWMFLKIQGSGAFQC